MTQSSGDLDSKKGISANFECVYSLARNSWSEFKFQHDLFRSLVVHLETEKIFPIKGDYHNSEIISIRILDASDDIKQLLFERDIDDAVPIVKFTGTLQFPGTSKFFITDGHGQRTDHSDEELENRWISLIPDLLDVSIQTYLAALNIAFPGAVCTSKNIWFVNGERSYFSRAYVNRVGEAIEYLLENDVAPANDLNPQDVVDWIFSLNGVFDGYSDTAAARCFNYFTRLYTLAYREDELSDLVWALAGIEALLVEANRSSNGQLREKLRTLFPSIKEDWLATMARDVYEFRSKMLRGNRQIKSEFRSDESDTSKRFYEEYHSLLFAIGMLLLLLQYLARTRRKQLHFETILR